MTIQEALQTKAAIRRRDWTNTTSVWDYQKEPFITLRVDDILAKDWEIVPDPEKQYLVGKTEIYKYFQNEYVHSLGQWDWRENEWVEFIYKTLNKFFKEQEGKHR